MNTKWITNKSGTQYLIDANDKYMERCLLGSGYQIRNWEFAKTISKPNGVALDIGASIGMNAVNYSQYFHSVEAFEPDPDVYECLLDTIVANDCYNVMTHPIAAYNKSQIKKFIKFPNATFANTLKPDSYVGRSRPQLSIQCEPIDDYEFDNVSFIKIDVEGWEMSVLEGCKNTIIKSSPVVQVEIKPQMLKRNNTNPLNIWSWFDSIGYQAHHFLGDVSNPILENNKIKFANIQHNLVDFWFVKT
jgi:FkbM family methyltransferase